jgi:hypothetical protein
VLFAVYAWVGGDEAGAPDRRIVVNAADVAQLGELWLKRWGRPPTPEELDSLVDSRVREEVLYRHALALGLDRDDTVVRRRLAQKIEFLFQDLSELVQPSPQDLAGYLAAHEDRFREPERLTFSHVYVSRDRRGEAAEAEAERILAELRQASPDGAHAGYGDPLALPSRYSDVDHAGIARAFGTDFADRVVELEAGAWHGPLESAYGVHLVFVQTRSESRLPGLAEIEAEVRSEWSAARRRETNEAAFAKLLESYEVVVEPLRPAEGEVTR